MLNFPKNKSPSIQYKLPLFGGWVSEPKEVVVLDGKVIEFSIKRSSRRRTLTLQFDKKGLRAISPARLPSSKIFNFVHEKKHWILKNLKKNENIKKENTNTVWVMGQQFNVVGVNNSGNYANDPANQQIKKIDFQLPNINFLQSCIYIKQSDNPQRSIRKVIGDIAKKEIANRLPYWARKMSLQTPRWKMSNAETLWGSCSKQTGIRFSWKMGTVFPMLMDYIIVHELAHIKFMDHSKKFWNEVAKHYPAWKVARKELREFENKISNLLTY